MKPSPTET